MKTIHMKCLDSRGQALVELALVIGLLLLLVMGIFEFGRAMFNKNTLTQAARGGARTAVVTPNLAPINNNLVCGIADAAAVSACKSLPTQEMKNAAKIQLTITGADGSSHTTAVTGDTVRVSITWENYPWLVLPRFAKNAVFPAALMGETSMRYE